MTEKTMTENEMREFQLTLNDRLDKWEDKMDELKEEIADIIESVGLAMAPIIMKHYQSSAPSTKVNEE